MLEDLLSISSSKFTVFIFPYHII